jgi:hypothetical protein
MADSVKISALDELVSGSVLGTTIVPVVEGGTTQKTKMSSIKAYVNSDVVTDAELASQIATVNSTINALTTNDISEAGNEYYTNAKVVEVLNTLPLLSGSALSVADGSTSVTGVDTITFSGATVSGDTGEATVTFTAGATLTVLDNVLPTIVNNVDQILFDGATVTNNGSGDITVSIAAASSGDSVAMMTHTASVDYSLTQLVTFTSSIDNTITGVNLQISEYTSSVDAHILDVATFTSSFSSSV